MKNGSRNWSWSLPGWKGLLARYTKDLMSKRAVHASGTLSPSASSRFLSFSAYSAVLVEVTQNSSLSL